MQHGYAHGDTETTTTSTRVKTWLMLVAILAGSIILPVYAFRAHAPTYKVVMLAVSIAALLISVAIFLHKIWYTESAKTGIWAFASLGFYGAGVWFGGLSSLTDKILLMALGILFTANMVLRVVSFKPTYHWRAVPRFRRTKITLLSWSLWLIPFVVTRQHQWRGVAIFVGVLCAGYLLWLMRADVGRVFGAVFVKFPKLVYTIVVGHPRYWYQEEGGKKELYPDGEGEFLVTTKPLGRGEFQRPHVYLPLGGLFRRPKIVWPSSCAHRWRIERRRLGFGGYHLVDSRGMRLELWHTVFVSRHSDYMGYLPIEEHKMLLVGFDSSLEMHQWGRFSISEALEQRSVGVLYDELHSKLLLEKEEHERTTDRARFEKEEAILEHQKALAKLEDARKEVGLRIAVELAKVSALVRAAPKNKKLAVARRQLTAIINDLVGDELKAKALLMDALDELERVEVQPDN